MLSWGKLSHCLTRQSTDVVSWQCGITAKYMINLTPDEVTLIRTILTALRGIKVRDIDKALLVLSKKDDGREPEIPRDPSMKQ
jgi:hypothetical protein